MSVDQAKVAAHNEAIHNPIVSEQCLLIEKAEEIYNFTQNIDSFSKAAGSDGAAQFAFAASLKAKKIVRQIDDNLDAPTQKGAESAGSFINLVAYPYYYEKGNAVDEWSWPPLHDISTNFDYIKIHSMGGPIDFKGGTMRSAESAAAGGPAQVPYPRDNLNFYHPFFEITPAEKAQIAHYCSVRISYYDKAGNLNEERTREVPFNQNTTDLSYLTQPRSVRQLAGLQNVTITHEGVDSLTKNIVLINATYIFQDLRKLVEEPFTQLLQIGNYLQVDDLYRYIEFELGWDTSNKDLKRRRQLDKLKLLTKANLVKYTFDLKDDGSIIVNAQYRGAVADVASNTYSNILQLSKTVLDEIKNNLSAIN